MVDLVSEQRQTMTRFQVTVGGNQAATHGACQVNQVIGIYSITPFHGRLCHG